MLAYAIKSALLLAALYGSFALLLSRETFHRFNRLALLGVLVASLILPAVQLSVRKPSYLSYEEVQIPHAQMIASPVQDDVHDIETPQPSLPATEEPMPEPTFRVDMMEVARFLYIIGLLASLATFAVQLLRLRREIRGGVHVKDEQGNTIVIRGGDFSPYSFLHYIIISASDYEHLRQPILAHEQAHIRLHHTCDLLLLQAVKALQWFNPFVYLLQRDIKAVHEYEADDAVLNSGIDAKTYQLLLVTKAVGGRLQTVCNNLSHHSLKKRITMMHKNNSNRWLMSKGLILPALMALALVAWAKPKVEEIIPSNETVSSVVKENDQVQDNSPVEVAVPGMGIVTTDEVRGFYKDRMLNAFIPKDDAKDFIKKHGPAIAVSWLKGTWVVKGDNSFIEEHPDCGYPWAFHTKYYDVMLDGKQLDVNNLPNLPASALKKVEIQMRSKGEKLMVSLTTKPVQIPADVKGNINPELTILLTGTPPKDSGAKTSIWERRGIYDGFSWKNYTICSWKWDVDDISVHLKEVAIRKDHNVRINLCRGVPQEHIDRITRLMKECGVTNYKFVRQ